MTRELQQNNIDIHPSVFLLNSLIIYYFTTFHRHFYWGRKITQTASIDDDDDDQQKKQLKWIANISRRENHYITKMLIFHSTSSKRLER